jgi:5-methylcytosine-specific restriction endonuclease McrA
MPNPTALTIPAPIAPAELVAEVLEALIEARDATTAEARWKAYDRLGLHRPFLEWLNERWQRGERATEKYPEVPMELRDPIQCVPAQMQREVFERDGHRCCWCGLPVLSKAVRSAHDMRGSADPPFGPDGLRLLGRPQGTRHVVHVGLMASADHGKPWSAGGRTDLSNLVTSCNPCNAWVRGDATLECVGFERRSFDALPGWPL